jgi:hypothetical protein
VTHIASRSRDGTAAAFSATAGALWGIALTVAAYTLRVSTTSGAHGRHTYTTVHDTGTRGLLLAAVPAVIGILVWLALHRTCALGTRWTQSVAIAVAIAVGGFALLAAASIGMFVMPMAFFMALGARLVPTAGSAPPAGA